MQFTFWVFIIFLLIVCCLNGCLSKICEDKTRNGTGPSYCCDNHEDINGTCIACKTGYLSDFGEQCRECPYGLYGSKCLEICRCKDTESCHHIEGCIEMDTTPVVKTEFVTVNDGGIDTKRSSFPHITSVDGSSFLELATTNDKFHRGIDSRSSSFPPITSVEDNSLLGLSTREIAVYSISIGGFTSLVLVLLCLGRYTLNMHRNRSVLLESENTRNNASMRVVSAEYIEGAYETIDESNMIDDRPQVTVPNTVETTSSGESTDSEHSHSLPNNEYLNSYQPIVTDQEKHEYTMGMRPDDSGSSGSSGTNYGYPNPYLEIIPDSDYLSIYSVPSSTSEKNEKEDEYRKGDDLEQKEYKEETKIELDIILQKHLPKCFKERISNSEMKLQAECTSISNEIPFDEIKDSFPLEMSVDDVLSGEASNKLPKCELGEFKPQ